MAAGGPDKVDDDAPDGHAPEVIGARHGMFGAHGSPDVSGYGGLERVVVLPAASSRPYGSWFDEVADELGIALDGDFDAAVERVVIEHGEITFFVRRAKLRATARALRDDPLLQFELCLGVSGVHWPDDTDRELHATYHFRSLTHGRTIRVETTCPDADPHVPSIVDIYPTNDWHERETFDFFGIVFDGHPALTRIMMPDDWVGHPQRKDYPLGGIPVDYKGATTPPPDERRAYT